MRNTFVRLAARAVIVEDGRLLIVNAWPDGKSPLMCAPGGGVDPGQSLPKNLSREVYEETGLTIEVGQPCMINEFHDPGSGFHQVEVFFRCRIIAGAKPGNWTDPEGIVTERRWVTAEELAALPYKPDSLSLLAFDPGRAPLYDPLELVTT
jgi:8-oxo-dGTP diphosphatase